MSAPLGSALVGAAATFRVWAPNASAVTVQVLDASGGVTGETPMVPDGFGYWQAEIPGLSAGTRYLYGITGPSGTGQRIDPYARAATNSVGASILYDEDAFGWTDSGYRTPGWDDLVIYELHVGTFDPDATGTVGTLADVATRLDYLRDLGVSAVELLPVAEFAMDRSWGYNPALPFAVEQAYGGPDGLKAFVDAAHRHGIAVILDVVYNHLGPSDLDHSLWRFDCWSQGDGGGIYFYEDSRGPTPWGTRPDYGREEVRRYLRDNAADWLAQYRLDGLRFDATAYIRTADGSGDPAQSIADGERLLREINDDTDAAAPWKLRIAEDMRGSSSVTDPTGTGGLGFSAQWDAGFVSTVRAAVTPPDDASRDVGAVAAALQRGFSGRWLSRVVFSESHDADANGGERLPSAIDQDDPGSVWAKKRSTLAAALTLTAPAIPMLFQGQEFLEDLWFADDRPVDWTKRDTYAGILQLYRDLIALRRNRTGSTAGLRGGGLQVHHVNGTAKVLGYYRWAAGGPRDDTVVLANFADAGYPGYRLGLPRPGAWTVRFNSDWSGYDPGFADTPSLGCDAGGPAQDGMPVSGAVPLGPYSVVVLSQDA